MLAQRRVGPVSRGERERPAPDERLGRPAAGPRRRLALSGITTLTTGRPFSVSLQTGVNNGAPSWPNRIGSDRVGSGVGSGKLDNPGVDLWFNPADFVAPPPNTYGDAGRGILYGSAHVNFDTSLSKRVKVGGGSNVEFRWDVFNCSTIQASGFQTAPLATRYLPHHVDPLDRAANLYPLIERSARSSVGTVRCTCSSTRDVL